MFMRYLFCLVMTVVICFGVQAVALRAVGGRTAKSESNYFSSLGRIQAGARGEPEVMLLGSSITGRLPDRVNGFEGFANMGCDGGSAVDVLRAIDEGILPAAPWLVVEANTLQLALDGRGSEVGGAMRAPWFDVGLKAPLLSAYARPAAFFYSRLLAGRIGGFPTDDTEGTLGVSSLPEVPTMPALHMAGPERILIEELSAIFRRLETKGSKVVIAWLPPARQSEEPPAWILELAARSGVPYWDLGQQAAPGTVALTDGVHMASPSAARTVRTLDAALQVLGAP